MKYNQLTPDRVNAILDRIAEGGTLCQIAEDTGVVNSTVSNLSKEFPLWGYYRTHPQE